MTAPVVRLAHPAGAPARTTKARRAGHTGNRNSTYVVRFTSGRKVTLTRPKDTGRSSVYDAGGLRFEKTETPFGFEWVATRDGRRLDSDARLNRLVLRLVCRHDLPTDPRPTTGGDAA